MLKLGMGQLARYLSIESILLKYCDEILQTPLCLSAHIMEGKVEILETNKKSEEVLHFYFIFGAFMDFIAMSLRGMSMFWLRCFIT